MELTIWIRFRRFASYEWSLDIWVYSFVDFLCIGNSYTFSILELIIWIRFRRFASYEWSLGIWVCSFMLSFGVVVESRDVPRRRQVPGPVQVPRRRHSQVVQVHMKPSPPSIPRSSRSLAAVKSIPRRQGESHAVKMNPTPPSDFVSNRGNKRCFS